MQVQLSHLDTPCLHINAEAMEKNLQEMAHVAADAGVALRPHVKTHKSPSLALRQLEYGAQGITVAKIGEADVMADAGIKDIRIAYPIVGTEKLARLAKLMDRADVSISIDSVDAARGLSELGQSRKKRIPVLLKINTGLDRVGVTPPEALSIGKGIAALPGVELVGILTHEGHALHEASLDGATRAAREAGKAMVDLAEELRKAGLNIKEVSVGSTATARAIAYVPGVTEIRPGTYIFNDLNEWTIGVATEETCALTLFVTVVSIPAENRAVIDAGSKTLTSDLLGPPSGKKGYGYVKGHPDVTIARLTEEHGMLEVHDARKRFKIGQHLEVVPNHVCPVVNLADVMYLMRNGQCERQIEVLARGKNR